MSPSNNQKALAIGEAVCRVRTRKRSPKQERGVTNLKLGCKPFKTATNLYLEDIKGNIKESTWKERRKKLNFVGGVLESLKKQGEIESMDPRHLTTKDIQVFKSWLVKENYDPATQRKLLNELKGMLEYYDNFVFEQLKRKGFKMPQPSDKPIRTFDSDALLKIFDATYETKNEWHGKMMRGAFALYWATMRRPSEIRLCRYSDLNLTKLQLHIEYPKGGGSWTGPTTVEIIRVDMLPYLQQYLIDREEYLRAKGRMEATALFPNLRTKKGYYSLSKFNEIKREIEEIAGVDFIIKDFRSSSSSAAVNQNPSLLPAVSTQLGHKNLSTTQKYYARIDAGRAGKQLREALNPGSLREEMKIDRIPAKIELPSQTKKPLNAVIPSKYEMSGYN
ncbi:MAG: Tyrosine recombinase XerC [Methanomassiliicoccales archaeon PtaU1.Bin124]|nr:MAG: Tyrosine recombinase XerC [Methanomassiliicoccales archaeon PtaU1.Bin124]